MYDDYEKLFKSWEIEGIVEEVKEDTNDVGCHYLPHRAVYKPESKTTPIRPVFDASCKAVRSPSLNDCLEKGPNLLELIPAVLLRFREKQYGLVSDIRKAYRMIEINSKDRDYLRFLWWMDYSQKKIKIYRHRRVVFGVNCSSFLLASVIEYHLSQVDELKKPIADQLLKSLYVDNCVTSVDSLEDYENFKDQASSVMAEAKMELRMWERTSKETSGIGSTFVECGLETDGDPNHSLDIVTSILGLRWNKFTDTLSLDINCENFEGPINKRKVLSKIQKVFDPIGLACPATLQPKLLVQKLWGEKIGWDVELSENQSSTFNQWYKDLQSLQQIQIPRLMTGGVTDRKLWQLHTFGDASKDAYAAVVFLRTINGSEVSIQLLQAKSRVAPIKSTTIPRLELLSCTIAALLTDSTKKALSLEEVPCYYWTDSTTALAWIHRNDEWGTFVGNRVKTICSLTDPRNWRHIPGVENPADLLSRGCNPSQLLKSRWWEGPLWLRGTPKHWPSGDSTPNENEVFAERKKTTASNLAAVEGECKFWYCSQSTFKKNITVIAWMKRFMTFLKSRSQRKKQNVSAWSVKEMEDAELTLLKLIQKDSFTMGESVISGIRVERKQDGLLHVKSKLTFREDSEGFRFPVLLPHSHPLVDQIIREQHFSNKHAGVQVVMGNLRERFWIIQGRRAIRRVLDKCVVCRRYTAKKPNVVPAPLPVDRIKTSRVIEVVGVDFAGPLYLKNKEKAWIALFTCAVYRCIHLELVQSLSTEVFMDAFSCFMSRRGRPEVVYSDNGTNFVGANNALKELDWDRILKEHGLQKIQWKFNPPSAPWWGGWWERLVRSVKELLRRTLRKSTLSFEKMRTLLCEVEAVINGRPLTTVTEDPDDLRPLTPAMFLQEMSCPVTLDRELLDACGFQRLYRKRKSLTADLKERFRREYLSLLVQRGKELSIREFKVGDVVLVGVDNKKRWEWPMGKIVELIPGKDGFVRVARVKTAVTILTRPLQHLYSLEVSSPTEVPPMPEKPVITKLKMKKKAEAEKPDKVTKSGRRVKKPDRFKI